jgi:hypothetical protein
MPGGMQKHIQISGFHYFWFPSWANTSGYMDKIGLIYIGVIAGGVATSIAVSMNVVATEMRWRVEGVMPRKQETIEEMHARLAIHLVEKPTYLLPWAICVGIGPVFAILLWLMDFSGESIFWLELSYLLSCVISAVVANEMYTPKWELMEKRHAAEIIFRYLPITDLVDWLLSTRLSGDKQIRELAVASFQGKVSDLTYALLNQLEHDPYQAVSFLARSLDQALQPLQDRSQPLSVAGLRLLVSLPRRDKITLADALNTREANVGLQTAGKILFSQFLHRKAFPHVYCTACNAWADKIPFKDVAWVQCLVCKDATDLVYPVRKVVGQIGGAAESQLQDGKLTLSLWNQTSMQATSAQIDVLEIIAGQGFDYNWAVSAVLGELRNPHLVGDRAYDVALIGDPPVDLNTLRLLQKP